MPLHVASVLSWLCGDGGFRTAMGVNTKVDCYDEVRPTIDACVEQYQVKAPTSGNRQINGRLKIVEFRQQLHDCFASRYVAQAAEEGRPISSAAASQPDPLAARLQRFMP